MFVTPQHQVKELRDEAGRNIVGGTMLCPELEREDWGGGYIHVEKNKEGRRRGRNRRGERKGEKEEEGGKGGMHMHTYVPVHTSTVEIFHDL